MCVSVELTICASVTEQTVAHRHNDRNDRLLTMSNILRCLPNTTF